MSSLWKKNAVYYKIRNFKLKNKLWPSIKNGPGSTKIALDRTKHFGFIDGQGIRNSSLFKTLGLEWSTVKSQAVDCLGTL